MVLSGAVEVRGQNLRRRVEDSPLCVSIVRTRIADAEIMNDDAPGVAGRPATNECLAALHVPGVAAQRRQCAQGSEDAHGEANAWVLIPNAMVHHTV